MITIRSEATVFAKDANLSPNQKPAVTIGADVLCPTGALGQDVTLPAATANAALPFPNGVTTAAILVVVAESTADLIVTLSGVAHNVPIGQALFLYGVAAANVSVSTALGGKIAYLVGG